MAFFDLIDMTVAYIQYLYILIFISPTSFPDIFVEPFRSLRYLSLEFIGRMGSGNHYNNLMEVKFPTWIPLDYRMRFVVIAVGIPFLVSLVGVSIVCASAAFGWILLILIAFFSMLFGALLMSNPWIYDEDRLPFKTRALLLSIGATFTVTLIAFGVYGICVWRRRDRRRTEALFRNDSGLQLTGVTLTDMAVKRSETNKRALAAQTAYETEKKKYVEQRRYMYLIPPGLLGLAGFVCGLILAGVPSLESIRFLQVSPMGRGVGVTVAILSIITIMWVVFGVFKRGRELHMKLYEMLSSAILGIMMMSISIIYIPVLMNIITILICSEVRCDAGMHLVDSGSVARATFNDNMWESVDNACYACNFSAHDQRCTPQLQENLCGLPVVENRLRYDNSVRCSDVDVFYKAALVVILLAYTVSYPVFLVVVADRATNILEKEYPLEKCVCDEFTDEELYYEKVRKSSNISAPIYEVFRRSFRRARLTFLFQRVFVVSIGAATSRTSDRHLSRLGMVLVSGVSALYFLYTVILRPYARPVENLYGSSHQIIIIIMGVLGLIGEINGSDTIPFAITVIVALIVILVPLVALVFGLFLTFRNDCERVERLQRRLQRGFTSWSMMDLSGNMAEGGKGMEYSSKQCCSTSSLSKKRGKASSDASLKRARNSNDACGSAGHKELTCKVRQGGQSDEDKKQARVLFQSTLGPREMKKLQEIPSDPTTEREPTDVEVRSDNPMDVFQNSDDAPAPPPLLGDDRTENGVEKENAGDEYLMDKCVFIPSAYFRNFQGVIVMPREEKGGMKKRSVANKAPNGVPRPSIAAAMHWVRHGWEKMTENGAKQKGGEGGETQHQRQKQKPSHQKNPERERDYANGKDGIISVENHEQRPRFFQWIGGWQKAFKLGDATLRYVDVFRQRQKIRQTRGFNERPYWFKPTETQLQTYSTKGGGVPCFSHKGRCTQPSDFTSSSTLNFFEKLILRKNVRYLPLYVPRSLDAMATNPLEDAPIKCNVEMKPDADSNAFADCRSAPPPDSGVDSSKFPEDATVGKSPSCGVPLASPGGKRTSSPLRSTLLDHDTVSMLEHCVYSARQKLKTLPCRHPLISWDQNEKMNYSKVIPRVLSEVQVNGADLTDWEAFKDRLLAEVQDSYPETDAGGTLLPVSSPFSVLEEGRKEEVAGSEPGKNGGQVVNTKEDTEVEKSMDHIPFLPETMPLLRRHFLLSRRLVLAFHQQREQLRALRAAVDHRIAMTVKKYMQIFFISLSFLTTVALVMCACGMLHTESDLFVDGIQRDNSVKSELLGHRSWESFVSHCCCIPMTELVTSFPYYVLDVEEWLCDDGRVKERVRRDTFYGELVSGYSVRDLCGMEFKNGCKLLVMDDDRVNLSDCDESIKDLEREKW